MRNNGFFIRSLTDRRISSLDYYLVLMDMANRIRDYRSKDHSLPKGNTLYRRLTDEILRLEERAELALKNHLNEATINLNQTRPAQIEIGESC